jgi:hypothetical protein
MRTDDDHLRRGRELLLELRQVKAQVGHLSGGRTSLKMIESDKPPNS